MSKDLVTIDSPYPGKSQFLVYEAEDGQVKIDVRLEGKRKVKRLLDYYNLGMIISVDYRVKSHVATRKFYNLLAITAAVTGKIDVRNQVSKKEAA